MISGGFKSNNFLSAHSKRLADAFFVTANSKGLADLNQRQSIAPPKGPEPRAEGVLSLACSCPIARSSRFFLAAMARLISTRGTEFGSSSWIIRSPARELGINDSVSLEA